MGVRGTNHSAYGRGGRYCSPGDPPDSVSTVFVSDTIPGFGAVGGVVADGLGFIYVADFRNAVWRISLDGSVDKFADGLYGASGNTIGLTCPQEWYHILC